MTPGVGEARYYGGCANEEDRSFFHRTATQMASGRSYSRSNCDRYSNSHLYLFLDGALILCRSPFKLNLD
ncbi:hypothetical protein IQ270_15555 [Microcoleus sp. LEGE 07076]|nr:hypothetical protein [Microcoleus sp. LEGE 07076]